MTCTARTLPRITASTSGSPDRRRRMRQGIAAILAALLAVGVGAGTSAEKADAAGNATACFTMASMGGVANHFPAWNVRVEMLYWNGRTWANAGPGYVRYTNSDGCVRYPLSNLLNSQQHGWFHADGKRYDWSGHYVAFRVNQVETLRTFYGVASPYLTPGNHSSSAHGTVYCQGITCP